MYGHSFADPDGHVWEVLHMDDPHRLSADPAFIGKTSCGEDRSGVNIRRWTVHPRNRW